MRIRYKEVVEVYNDFITIGSTDHLRNRDWRKPGNEERLEAKRTNEIRKSVERYRGFNEREVAFFRDWIIRNPGAIKEVNDECRKRGIEFELKA